MGAGDELQFEHAEYVAPAEVVCAACKRTIARYYETNGKRICETCRGLILTWRPGTPGKRFWRAAGLGSAAAVLGSILYLGILRLTGMELGLVSIVVGIGVGIAVRKGSYATGGAGYQILAIALTYLSIAASYYVVLLDVVTAKGHVIHGIGYVVLVPFAFAVPFFSAADGNVLGLVIVGFGLYEAWKFNKRPKIVITGPFEIQAPAPHAG
jgi:hypothetical protein